MFTTALLLTCLLQPPAKAEAKPPGIPPTFAKISSGDTKDSLVLTELKSVTKAEPYTFTEYVSVSKIVVVDGKSVSKVESVPVTKTAMRTIIEAVPVTRIVTTKSHKLVDLDGREVSWALHENKPVLLTSIDGLADEYKAMFKLGTLVVVPLKLAAQPMMPAVKLKS